MLRITALTENIPGCTHVRLIAPLTALARRGWASVTLCYLSHTGPRPWQAVEEADLVICQRLYRREHLALLSWAQLRGKRTVYEIDDDLLGIPADHPSAHYRDPEVRAVIREGIERADLVTTSTPTLAEILKAYNPRVAVLENAVDPLAFGRRGKGGRPGTLVRVVGERSVRNLAQRLCRRMAELRVTAKRWVRFPQSAWTQRLIVGYAGSVTHERDFHAVSTALQRLLDEFRGRIACRFIDFCPSELRIRPDIEVWAGSVHYRRYAARLLGAGFDIAVAPLKADRFNVAKSDIKYLEYSICGYPTVAADMEPFRRSVSSERGVLVAPEDPLSWYEAIRELIEAPERRRALADAAQCYVFSYRTVDALLPRWMAVWAQAAGREANSRDG